MHLPNHRRSVEILQNMVIMYTARLLNVGWNSNTCTVLVKKRDSVDTKKEWDYLLRNVGLDGDTGFHVRHTAVAEQIIADQVRLLFLKMHDDLSGAGRKESVDEDDHGQGATRADGSGRMDDITDASSEISQGGTRKSYTSKGGAREGEEEEEEERGTPPRRLGGTNMELYRSCYETVAVLACALFIDDIRRNASDAYDVQRRAHRRMRKERLGDELGVLASNIEVEEWVKEGIRKRSYNKDTRLRNEYERVKRRVSSFVDAAQLLDSSVLSTMDIVRNPVSPVQSVKGKTEKDYPESDPDDVTMFGRDEMYPHEVYIPRDDVARVFHRLLGGDALSLPLSCQ